MREPHVLAASKKTTVPRRMVFFDSESQVDIAITEEEIDRAIAYQKGDKERGQVRKDHDPYLISATFYRDRKSETGKISRKQRDYTRLNSTDLMLSFWQDVDSFATWNEKTYLFAHNAKYDVQVTRCVPDLVDMGYRVTSFSDSNPFILQFEKHHYACECVSCREKKGIELPEGRKPITKKKHIIILSSTNYYAQPLAKLGKVFNLPKLDFDHGQEILPLDPAFMETAAVYGRRDVDILEMAMITFIDFIKRENLGKFSMTVAGQAFAAFRQRFLTTDIYIHSDREALEVERRAYAGGRNEAFRMGKVDGDIYYVDINSMYPYVMKNFLYPKKLRTFWKTATLKQLRDAIMEDNLVCCDALVRTDVPIFHVKRGKLIFPTGEFWTTLSTPELIQAFERGMLLEVKNVCLYEPANIFEAYVDYYYEARLEAKHEGDAVHDHLYKIFLNSLYGKFGQKNIHWERVGDEDPKTIHVFTEYNRETRERKTIKIFGGGRFEQHNDMDDIEAFNSFPAVAAHVTAYARMQLFTYMEAAGKENVYYCDTDSLFTNAIGYERLREGGHLDPDRLGALKLEDQNDDLQIFGCKDYFFAGKAKIKGVSKNAVPIAPDEDGNIRFAVTQWGGFSDRLREGDFSNYHNTVIIKTLHRNYDKAQVEGDTVTPFAIDWKKEQEAAAMKEIEAAKKEAAASLALSDRDPIAALIQIHGHIMAPRKGDYYYTEYTQYIPRKVKGKYFRIGKGQAIDEWCSAAGYTVEQLMWELGK